MQLDKSPGMSTASWEVTGVLYRGGGPDPGAQGSVPLGEAPTSAPQAKKILACKAVFLEFCVIFEWLSCAREAPDHSRLTPYRTRRPTYLGPLMLYLNPTLQGCYQVLKRCGIRHFTPCFQLHNPL